MKSRLLIVTAIICGCISTHAKDISLLDLPVKEYKVGFGDLWIGKNLTHSRVLVQGQETKDYLFAHAPSRIIYQIPGDASSFSAWGVRIDGDDNVYGSWFYIVKIDGKEVFRSKPLVDYEAYEIPIHVSIPKGSKEIELVIDDMGNNFADHSIWAVPTFK
jgi:hypothetical protein